GPARPARSSARWSRWTSAPDRRARSWSYSWSWSWSCRCCAAPVTTTHVAVQRRLVQWRRRGRAPHGPHAARREPERADRRQRRTSPQRGIEQAVALYVHVPRAAGRHQRVVQEALLGWRQARPEQPELVEKC